MAHLFRLTSSTKKQFIFIVLLKILRVESKEFTGKLVVERRVLRAADVSVRATG